jgi:hypothetical protein
MSSLFFCSPGCITHGAQDRRAQRVTAARWRRATSQLIDQVKKGNAESVWFGDFPQPGGIPIIQDGHTLGAMEASKAVLRQFRADRSSHWRGDCRRDGQGDAKP